MILRVFSVYDSKAVGYLPPFFMQNSGVAIRAFSTSVNDPGHSFHAYPQDYTLFNVGTWDDETCLFSVSEPVSIGNGIEFVISDADEAKLPLPAMLREQSS